MHLSEIRAHVLFGFGGGFKLTFFLAQLKVIFKKKSDLLSGCSSGGYVVHWTDRKT